MMENPQTSDTSAGSNQLEKHQQYFQTLQKSTDAFLGTLEDWRISADFSTNPLPSSVVVTLTTVKQYVVAFNTGMSAAQDGFDFASNGISFTNAITPGISDLERNSFINQMEAIASQGKEKSKIALDDIRKVRVKLNETIKSMRSDGQGSKTPRRETSVLEQNLAILDEFQDWLSWYIKWWNKNSMTASYQNRNVNLYAGDHGELRRKAVLSEWQKLKDEYAHYVFEMGLLQDRYANLFKLVPGIDVKDTPAIQQKTHSRENTIKDILDASSSRGSAVLGLAGDTLQDTRELEGSRLTQSKKYADSTSDGYLPQVPNEVAPMASPLERSRTTRSEIISPPMIQGHNNGDRKAEERKRSKGRKSEESQNATSSGEAKMVTEEKEREKAEEESGGSVQRRKRKGDQDEQARLEEERRKTEKEKKDIEDQEIKRQSEERFRRAKEEREKEARLKEAQEAERIRSEEQKKAEEEKVAERRREKEEQEAREKEQNEQNERIELEEAKKADEHREVEERVKAEEEQKDKVRTLKLKREDEETQKANEKATPKAPSAPTDLQSKATSRRQGEKKESGKTEKAESDSGKGCCLIM